MRKWYSLIDKVYRIENLARSFKAVKANKGAPGIDGETIGTFEAGLPENLQKLHEELETGVYQPQPVRRAYIEKEDGSQRPLGIPTVSANCTKAQSPFGKFTHHSPISSAERAML